MKRGAYWQDTTPSVWLLRSTHSAGSIGPDAKAAIPALEEMAEKDADFRPVADKALAKIRAK